MKRYVLDCSVSAAWFLGDEHDDLADRCLDLLSNGEAVVPSLWVVEMTNALLVAERRKRIRSEDVAEAFELLLDLPITVHPVPRDHMPDLAGLAREHDLTAYDARYLDVALELRLPLATLDLRQRSAAKAAAVKLL